MSVQIVRTLVYTYPDHETAERDMGLWQIPANGVRNVSIGRGRSIHSATTPMQTLKEEAEKNPAIPEEEMEDDLAEIAAEER